MSDNPDLKVIDHLHKRVRSLEERTGKCQFSSWALKIY